MKKPTKSDLLDVMDQIDMDLSAMVGRWGDAITPEHRAELRAICKPGLDILIKAGRRGQTRNPVPLPRRKVPDLLPPED